MSDAYSPKLGIAVGATLAIGTIASYALAIVTIPGSDWDGSGAQAVKMGDVSMILTLAGKDWVTKLFWAGLVMALICAFAPMTSSAGKSVLIDLGCLASLYLPVVILQHHDGASVGIGLIVLIGALAIAAIIPWLPIWEPETATSVRLAEEPAWLKRQA